MAPKKKIRNNKAKKSQEENPRPPTTITCPKCDEAIIVPRTCKHGKKLINCQGTGCTTTHIEEHNAHCIPITISAPKRPKAPSGPAPDHRSNLNDVEIAASILGGPTDPVVAYWSAVRAAREENNRLAKRHAETLASMTPERLHAMGALTVQLNAAVKSRGGKPVRYLEGAPFTEWFSKLESGPYDDVNEWREKLKGMVEGSKTADEIGYDDEESEDEGDACPTPQVGDEGDVSPANETED
ncbi:hypothetical protein A1O7_04785 [Cladophialophora yegresii CBS 114405]|uniref:Uncharacterized protein n=1 Tax=Cladophialophora yegresii CBS 114405 TaxID=1182544 RepID=W9VXR3_9EURO|nr:uncharacterized protein A1O7_04785 [Cladophialophora yegresii CBS 114405]EXJ60632.1 hypothetical protein A1O7_04785 [Cladophialophora yegresii CBS 114405]